MSPKLIVDKKNLNIFAQKPKKLRHFRTVTNSLIKRYYSGAYWSYITQDERTRLSNWKAKKLIQIFDIMTILFL